MALLKNLKNIDTAEESDQETVKPIVYDPLSVLENFEMEFFLVQPITLYSCWQRLIYIYPPGPVFAI